MKRPEDDFHIAVAGFLQLALPPDCWWTTIPTGNLGKVGGAIMQAKGYRKGTPDILLVYDGRALWIELKAPKGTLKGSQPQVHREITAAGSPVATIRTLAQLEYTLGLWGIPLKARIAA